MITTVTNGFEVRGYDVTIALGGPSSTDRTWEKNISKVIIGPYQCFKTAYHIGKIVRPFKIIKWLYGVLRQTDYDVVIAVAPMEVIYSHISLKLLGRRSKVSLLSWFHFPLSNFDSAWPGLISYILSPAKRINLRCHYLDLCDAHLAISTGITHEIIKANQNNKIYTVYNPLMNEKGDLIDRPEYGAEKTFIFIGRLNNKQKRIDRILLSLSEVSNKHFHLTIIGDGPDKESLISMSYSLGLSDQVMRDLFTINVI